MHDDTTKLVAAVSASRSIMASAAALIAGLGERIRNALDNDDTDALNALASELTDGPEATALAAAIAENTPAADIAEHDEGTAVIPPEPAQTGGEDSGDGSTTGADAADTPAGGAGEDTLDATGDEGAVNTQ